MMTFGMDFDLSLKSRSGSTIGVRGVSHKYYTFIKYIIIEHDVHTSCWSMTRLYIVMRVVAMQGCGMHVYLPTSQKLVLRNRL